MDLFSTGLTGSAFIGAITANVQDVLSSIGPIIELVVGVILAFVLARYLISLFSSVGKSDGPHHIKSDLNRYHYSDMQMEHEGIEPNGISEFDEGRF